MSGSKDKPVMEGFVTGDFKHRAHTFVLCLHPGDTQKSPIKEAKHVPSVSPVPALSCPPGFDLRPSSHLKRDESLFQSRT